MKNDKVFFPNGEQVIWTVIESHKTVGNREQEIASFDTEEEAEEHAKEMSKQNPDWEFTVRNR